MKFKKIGAILLSTMVISSSLLVNVAKADSVVGESIYTLGKNLSTEQQTTLLKEMGYQKDEQIIYVTNQEEHTYLGGIIPAAKIGTRALSSSRITMAKENTGIIVSTRNISWVTAEMYTNALITAGVKDADIYITAPFQVSGTAALTGLMKAYESSTGTKIDAETKKVANEEMVTTAELADKIGSEEANSLMTNVKNTIAEEQPKNAEEIQAIVDDVAKDLSIALTADQSAELTALLKKMDEVGVDWNNIKDQIDIIKDSWGDKFQEIDKGFFENILNAISDFFSSIWDSITNFFSSIFGSSTGSSKEDSEITPPENENTAGDEQNTESDSTSTETNNETNPSSTEQTDSETETTTDESINESPSEEESTNEESTGTETEDTDVTTDESVTTESKE